MKRIITNENRLDNINNVIKDLDLNLDSFNSILKDYKLLNKYYGSKEWFKDKDDFEKGKIKNIKAGVLSEDAVWNQEEDIKDIIDKMKAIIKKYDNMK